MLCECYFLSPDSLPFNACSSPSATRGSLQAVTLPVNLSLVGEELPLLFEFYGGLIINSSLNFTYREDPLIESVTPNEFITRYGIILLKLTIQYNIIQYNIVP